MTEEEKKTNAQPTETPVEEEADEEVCADLDETDYEDYDESYVNDLMEQLAEEREEKYRRINRMTPEERDAYYREQSRRMQEFAQEHGIKIETVTLKTPKDPDDADD